MYAGMDLSRCGNTRLMFPLKFLSNPTYTLWHTLQCIYLHRPLDTLPLNPHTPTQTVHKHPLYTHCQTIEHSSLLSCSIKFTLLSQVFGYTALLIKFLGPSVFAGIVVLLMIIPFNTIFLKVPTPDISYSYQCIYTSCQCTLSTYHINAPSPHPLRTLSTPYWHTISAHFIHSRPISTHLSTHQLFVYHTSSYTFF